MSCFSKRQYVWLESHFRDELHLAKEQNNLTEEEDVKKTIWSLGSALKLENPEGFDEQLFYKNIFNPVEIQPTEDRYKNSLNNEPINWMLGSRDR